MALEIMQQFVSQDTTPLPFGRSLFLGNNYTLSCNRELVVLFSTGRTSRLLGLRGRHVLHREAWGFPSHRGRYLLNRLSTPLGPTVTPHLAPGRLSCHFHSHSRFQPDHLFLPHPRLLSEAPRSNPSDSGSGLQTEQGERGGPARPGPSPAGWDTRLSCLPTEHATAAQVRQAAPSSRGLAVSAGGRGNANV